MKILGNKIVKEIIKFKLQSVQDTLASILGEWNQENEECFIKKTRSGELAAAEMDAITVRQLITDIEKLESLLRSIR